MLRGRQRSCLPPAFRQVTSIMAGDRMAAIDQPRNILVFADGTGNEGGLLPDESRTNVYKRIGLRASILQPTSTRPSRLPSTFPASAHQKWRARHWSEKAETPSSWQLASA